MNNNSDLINIEIKILTAEEFLNIYNYNKKSVFIKFWNIIYKDEWINLDILNLNCNHKILLQLLNESIMGDYKCNNNIISVNGECLKEILLKLKNNKLLKEYIELEKLGKLYITYNNEYNKLKLEKEESKNKLIDNIIISRELLSCNEFIYIATNDRYATQGIFKVGRTINLKARLNGYGTGRVNNDKLKYIYYQECNDSVKMEAMIFSLLKNFRLPNETELFYIKYPLLKNIIESILTDHKKHINFINHEIEKYYHDLNYTVPIYINQLPETNSNKKRKRNE